MSLVTPKVMLRPMLASKVLPLPFAPGGRGGKPGPALLELGRREARVLLVERSLATGLLFASERPRVADVTGGRLPNPLRGEFATLWGEREVRRSLLVDCAVGDCDGSNGWRVRLLDLPRDDGGGIDEGSLALEEDRTLESGGSLVLDDDLPRTRGALGMNRSSDRPRD
jgi:hypothetical protein